MGKTHAVLFGTNDLIVSDDGNTTSDKLIHIQNTK